MAEILYLESGALRDVATMANYIDAVRDGYIQRGHGAPAEPRSKLFGDDQESFLMYYGAMLPDSGVMGVFTYIAGFGGGDSWFLTYLADADTGEPTAIIDSPAINPYKTGATGAIGTDALARKDATTVGIIGSGTQARGQLLATDVVRDLTDVVVYSPTEANREAFAREMDDRIDADVQAVASSDEAVRDRDIVITATRSGTPVFDGRALSPGTHVTAMGQSHPERSELDATTVARSRYVADHRTRVQTASGSFRLARRKGVISDDHLAAELGEVLIGAKSGRKESEQITVFDSGGTGIETVAASHMVCQRAIELDRGTRLPITPGSEGFTI
jgi:alanine dehydrogenase